MAQPTLTELPTALVAGDSLLLRQAFSDYPAPTWTLTFSLRNKDNSTAPLITWTFADEGSGAHLLTLASTDTAPYIPGDYYVVGLVTSGTQRQKVFDGYIEIKPDYAAAGDGTEMRSHAERVLYNLKAAMESLSTATAETVSVEGLSYSRRNLQTLQQMIGVYQSIVDSERLSTGQNQGRYSRRITVRFTRPA